MPDQLNEVLLKIIKWSITEQFFWLNDGFQGLPIERLIIFVLEVFWKDFQIL